MFPKTDKRLYKINSDRGGFFEVYDSLNGRYLTLRGKFIGVHSNYKNIHKTYFFDLVSELKEKKDHLKNALIFGLGSGTLQNLLIKKYPEIKMTTIESDSGLIDIHDYFFQNFDKKKNTMIHADAFQFVKNSESIYNFHNKFDLLVVDFNLMGSEFYSEVFIKEIKNFLTSTGILVMVFERKNFLQDKEILRFVQRLELYYNKVTILYSKTKILEVFCSDK